MTLLQRIVIVGAGLAGLRAGATLRAEGFDGRLDVLGEERHRPYDRPPLSKGLLDGTVPTADLMLPGTDDLDAQWHLSDPAVHLDTRLRDVVTKRGRRIPFDGLVIATGARARPLPSCDPGHAGAYSLRTLDDAEALREMLEGAAHLLVVGGGFVAVEVASAANALGASVEITARRLPLTSLGSAIAQACALKLAERGITVRAGRHLAGIGGSLGSVRAQLDDGTEIDCDAILVATGDAPATEWLEGSGVPLDDGVVCTGTLAVRGMPDVVAAGDVARWPHPLFDGHLTRLGHWSNAGEQGAAAARALLHGPESAVPFATVPSFWSDHAGTRLNGVGLASLADRHETVVTDQGNESVVVGYRGDRLVSAITYGKARPLDAYRRKLIEQAERTSHRIPATVDR